MENNQIIREFYDKQSAYEWERLAQHPFEFEINLRFLKRHIKPGDRVLDVGGGPGRYSFALKELGCDVTLVDLSPGNVRFAEEKARELGLPLRAFAADARDLSCLADELFDHVLCMGPLYHLLEESDRERAVRECLAHLKPGGTLAVSFISLTSGLIFMGRENPGILITPAEAEPLAAMIRDDSWGGQGFTRAFFTSPGAVLPFMERFPLEKLHFLASEPVVCAFEDRILAQPPEVVSAWMDLAEKVCEQERFYHFSEHLLYIGRKNATPHV